MADIFGDDDYLQPGFDANSLTAPRLRNALNAHDIPFNLSAKKSELVDIFNAKLQPKARRILTQRAKIRRTSMGIESVQNSQSSMESAEEDDGVEELPEPVIDTRSRRTTRSTRASTAESFDEPTPRATPATRRRATRTPADSVASSVEPETVRASKTSRRGMVADSSADESTYSRASRRSAVPEPLTDNTVTPRRTASSKSAFSSDNPFQSGSSPLAEEEEEEEEPRRRTTGRKSEGPKTTTRRERTEEPTIKQEAEDGPFTSSRTVTIPSKSLRRSPVKQEPVDVIEAGEEFTPEETQALETSQEAAIARPRRKKAKKQSSALASAPWVILTTLLGAYAVWWRQEKLEVGYCGVGKTVNTLQELQIPEALDFLQPKCEPCPQHAYCYSDMEARCEPDFILRHHSLSLGGFLPFTPTCEPDGEKARKVKAVADRAVEELRERRAKFECGELTEDNGKKATVVEIPEPSLKAAVSSKKRKTMSDEEFEDIWKGAIGEIKGRDEVTADAQGLSGTLLLSSNSLIRLSWGCSIRRSVRATLAEYSLYLGSIVMLFFATWYSKRQLTIRSQDKARVPGLVAMVLDRLATQAALYEEGSLPDAIMSLGQLRDDVLREEFSNRRRDEIWQRVQAIVEKNANVRASVREGRSGDVGRQWEWIGSTDSVNEARLIDRRRSGRYSMLPATPDDRSLSPIKSDGDSAQPRRWDEGRPIY